MDSLASWSRPGYGSDFYEDMKSELADFDSELDQIIDLKNSYQTTERHMRHLLRFELSFINFFIPDLKLSLYP